MGFFRRKPSPPPNEPPAGAHRTGDVEGMQVLATRKEQELRSLGEIYYLSSRKGRVDQRSIDRKMREIEKLDEQLDGVKTSLPPGTARPPRIGGPSTPRVRTCGCGTAMHPLDRFCSSCGKEADVPVNGRLCPACQALVEARARFCRLCGGSMTAAGPLTVRHPLTGQQASFDFQATPSVATPRGPAGEAGAASTAYDADQDSGEAERAEDGRDWIRDLERFARPAQVDTHAFFQRGREYLVAGRCREAAAEFEAVLLQNPRDARAQYFLGVARYKNGDLDAATEAFERATRIDRTNADAHNDLGLCYAKRGMRREALEHYVKALQLHAGHCDAHYNIAHLYIQHLSYPDAIRHLQLYLQHSPRARDLTEVTELIEQLQAACAAGHGSGA